MDMFSAPEPQMIAAPNAPPPPPVYGATPAQAKPKKSSQIAGVSPSVLGKSDMLGTSGYGIGLKTLIGT